MVEIPGRAQRCGVRRGVAGLEGGGARRLWGGAPALATRGGRAGGGVPRPPAAAGMFGEGNGSAPAWRPHMTFHCPLIHPSLVAHHGRALRARRPHMRNPYPRIHPCLLTSSMGLSLRAASSTYLRVTAATRGPPTRPRRGGRGASGAGGAPRGGSGGSVTPSAVTGRAYASWVTSAALAQRGCAWRAALPWVQRRAGLGFCCDFGAGGLVCARGSRAHAAAALAGPCATPLPGHRDPRARACSNCARFENACRRARPTKSDGRVRPNAPTAAATAAACAAAEGSCCFSSLVGLAAARGLHISSARAQPKSRHAWRAMAPPWGLGVGVRRGARCSTCWAAPRLP